MILITKGICSWVSIDTLVWHMIDTSIGTQLTFWAILSQHLIDNSIDTRLTPAQQSVSIHVSVNLLIRIHWKLVNSYCQLTVQWDVNQVVIKCHFKRWWSVNPASIKCRSRVSFDTQPWIQRFEGNAHSHFINWLCSSRKYPYFPHRRDWNFLGCGGFCKAKKFKEIYEA